MKGIMLRVRLMPNWVFTSVKYVDEFISLLLSFLVFHLNLLRHAFIVLDPISRCYNSLHSHYYLLILIYIFRGLKTTLSTALSQALVCPSTEKI